jgi:hypothetical protein
MKVSMRIVKRVLCDLLFSFVCLSCAVYSYWTGSAYKIHTLPYGTPPGLSCLCTFNSRFQPTSLLRFWWAGLSQHR